MISVFLAVAVLMQTQVSPDEGHIWVRTVPGVVVTVDGVKAGVTTEAAAGLQIVGVKTGVRELTLTIPGKGSKKLRVRVEREQTAIVEVPAVGMRTQREVPPGALEIEVVPFQPPCVVTLGNSRYELEETWLRTDDVPPGKYPLVVRCGRRSARKDVEIVPDKTLLARANLATSEIAITGDRPRVISVNVRTSRTRIEESVLPEDVKRALIAGLNPGVEVIRVSRDAAGITTIVFEMMDGYFSSGPLRAIPRVEIFAEEWQRYSDYRYRLTLVFGLWRE